MLRQSIDLVDKLVIISLHARYLMFNAATINRYCPQLKQDIMVALIVDFDLLVVDHLFLAPLYHIVNPLYLPTLYLIILHISFYLLSIDR